MKKDTHQWAVTLAEAKVYHHQIYTRWCLTLDKALGD